MFHNKTGSVVTKIPRISEIDSFVIDQCGLQTTPGCIILYIPIGVRLLKLYTCVLLHCSLQYRTWPEFAAKLFNVHLHLIFVWANMMKGYAWTYKLYNNEGTETIYF